jgi:hypothetical protein
MWFFLSVFGLFLGWFLRGFKSLRKRQKNTGKGGARAREKAPRERGARSRDGTLTSWLEEIDLQASSV